MNTKKYLLREISSEQELEQFLRLRYKCFCKSDAEFFVPKNVHGIDLNYYDKNSNHYGLYLVQNKSKEPVGYFRIILEEPTKADRWIQNISKRFGLNHLSEHRPIFKFPCLGVHPDTRLEQDFYEKKEATEKVGEASRLFIVEAERSLKLSLQLIKSAIAIAELHVQHAFVGCFYEHSKVYTRFGFKQYPGSSASPFDLPVSRKKGVVLYCRSAYLPFEIKTNLKMIQNQYAENNSMTFSL